MKTLLCSFILILPLCGATVEQSWLRLMEEGRILRESGQLGQAAERYADAVRIADCLDSGERAKLLATTALAAAYADNGQMFNAEKAYQLALSLARTRYGGESFEYGITLGSLGALYVEQGALTRGEPAVRESLRILLLTARPNGEHVARQQIALAQLLTLQNKFEEAARQLEAAIAAPLVELRLTALNALGVVRLREHRSVEAARLFEEALGIARGNALEIRLLTNLGDARAQSGKLTEAGDAYRKAVELDDVRGVEDQARGTLLKHYADFLRKAGQCAESRLYKVKAQRVLQAAARASGADAQVDASTMLLRVR